jgi:hypothetical protein
MNLGEGEVCALADEQDDGYLVEAVEDFVKKEAKRDEDERKAADWQYESGSDFWTRKWTYADILAQRAARHAESTATFWSHEDQRRCLGDETWGEYDEH